MAVSRLDTATKPDWPAEPIDPMAAWVDYEPLADEFLVYFGGKPVPAVSEPLDGPGFEDVAIMVGLGLGNESTDQVVGIQVIPLLLGAVPDQPHWAALAWAAMAGDFGTELLKEHLPRFFEEVAVAFRKYWTPAPPTEEQLAEIRRRAAPGA